MRGADPMKCILPTKRGWVCRRLGHPANQPCALVPSWWNLRDFYRVWIKR